MNYGIFGTNDNSERASWSRWLNPFALLRADMKRLDLEHQDTLRRLGWLEELKVILECSLESKEDARLAALEKLEIVDQAYWATSADVRTGHVDVDLESSGLLKDMIVGIVPAFEAEKIQNDLTTLERIQAAGIPDHILLETGLGYLVARPTE